MRGGQREQGLLPSLLSDKDALARGAASDVACGLGEPHGLVRSCRDMGQAALGCRCWKQGISIMGVFGSFWRNVTA